MKNLFESYTPPALNEILCPVFRHDLAEHKIEEFKNGLVDALNKNNTLKKILEGEAKITYRIDFTALLAIGVVNEASEAIKQYGLAVVRGLHDAISAQTEDLDLTYDHLAVVSGVNEANSNEGIIQFGILDNE